MEWLTEAILATGALGVAAFGIVEGLKPWSPGGFCLGLAGYKKLEENLGPLWKLLPQAFGPAYDSVLKAIYRGERSEVQRTLQQGIRLGLTPENAEEAAAILGNICGKDLKEAAAAIRKGTALKDNLRAVVGRFELAADARIDAAIRLAETEYIGVQKLAASVASLAIALITAAVLVKTVPQADLGWEGPQVFLLAVLVGIAAVPLAPIAKDVATAIQSAAQALRSKA